MTKKINSQQKKSDSREFNKIQLKYGYISKKLLMIIDHVNWAIKAVRNPNIQVVITHASHVCSQHLFGLPLRMNEMHRTQFDHTHFDLLPLVI